MKFENKLNLSLLRWRCEKDKVIYKLPIGTCFVVTDKKSNIYGHVFRVTENRFTDGFTCKNITTGRDTVFLYGIHRDYITITPYID